MKSCITIILFSFLLVLNIFAQKSIFVFHISNPLGMIQKAGIKVEIRAKQLGFLATGTKYYGSLPKYPGMQVGLETRYYFKNDSIKKHENFVYAKYIYGHQYYVARSGDGFSSRPEVPENYYHAIGGGVGRHFNFDNFFIEFNGGFKYAISDIGRSSAFYFSRPGSYFNLHLNFGFQF